MSLKREPFSKASTEGKLFNNVGGETIEGDLYQAKKGVLFSIELVTPTIVHREVEPFLAEIVDVFKDLCTEAENEFDCLELCKWKTKKIQLRRVGVNGRPGRCNIERKKRVRCPRVSKERGWTTHVVWRSVVFLLGIKS